MNKKPEVRSIQPKPDEDLCKTILRLKNNPDFVAFREILIAGRSGVLAYLSCSPQFTERQCNYIQGRVHELSDLERVIEGIEQTLEEFATSRAVEGER